MKKLMMIAGTGILLGLGQGCRSTNGDACIDESRISNQPCTQQYEPVCGCDGKTYGNACEAEHAGVLRWTQGECTEETES